MAAKGALKYPPVRFNGEQARTIGCGFAGFVEKNGLTVHACSILPDHVHLVIARHAYRVEQMVNLLKGAATRELLDRGGHSFATRKEPVPKMWGRGHWKVFLEDDGDIRRSIRYVEQNPVKEGKRVQKWSFVRPFVG